MVRCIILFTGSCLLLSACETYPTEIHFKLYGQGSGFSGEYTLDDGDEAFPFQSEESTSDVFVYRSGTVEIDDMITIDVFPDPSEDENADDDETEMTSLTCKVFDEDGESLYTETYGISSTHMKTFVYDLEDAKDTDGDDTDG